MSGEKVFLSEVYITTKLGGQKMRRSMSERIFNVFNILIMLFLIIITIYPLWYVLCGSFSDGNKLMAHTGILLLPKGYSLGAYEAVFKNNMITTGFLNTMIILVGGLALNLVLSSIGAYGLSRKGVYWNRFFMKLITITMFISGGLVPTYLLIANTLKLNNTLWAIILPACINTYNLIIMRTSFSDIPESLIESAHLDGAGHSRILFQIVLPLSKAILAVMTLYYAVAHWNSWFTASIYLKDRGKYPLQLVLREILIQNSTMALGDNADINDKYYIGETVKYATIIVSTVPILLVYPFLQKYFVSGVMTGAVKG